jgi:glycosyltransferase involved in cell wall biosynthesis
MLLGIEASSAVSRRPTGVGNYTANLVAGLQRLGASGHDLRLLYFSNRYTSNGGNNGSQLTEDAIYPHDQLRSRSLWIQFGLARSIARTRPDLCHFPNHLAPILGDCHRPAVVTMHDMSVYRYPQYQPWKTVAVHRAIMPTVARRSHLILTPSESARRDVIYYLDVPEERVRVVYEGVGKHFQPHASSDNPTATAVRLHYNLRAPFILTVGTLEPRKNQAALIDAFGWLVQQERLPHHLVLVGAHGWKDGAIRSHARRSEVAGRIHFLGYVPAIDLPGLYRAAAAFAFPSFYEGFGLPVLEALACGVPSLISTDPALTEVAGEGTTVRAEPHSVQDIAGGLWTLLTNESLVSRLRARGLARAGEFSWDKCATETWQVYREALDEQPNAIRLCVAR